MSSTASRSPRHRFLSLLPAILIGCCGFLGAASGQEGRDLEGGAVGERDDGVEPATLSLPQAWADAIDWRSIGPANMGGRITALSVVESDPMTWWAATASGGLLKTTNNGTTWTHQFDNEATVSIGDVCAAPSNPSIVYVGTGESNPRNSVSWGNGVYKSEDGGETWRHLGLDGTFQTGRVVVHPNDPDTVYVAALGRLWGPNEQRGIFKSTDGGETWEKVFFIDDRTGVIELKMHPTDPDTFLAAAYERQRGRLDDDDPEVKFGEGTGIYKTTDGGRNWRRINAGLPTVRMGRIGIDWSRSAPNIVYAVVESEKIGQEPQNAPYAGFAGENADVGARITQVADESPAGAAGLMVGDIVISVDGELVHSYADLLAAVRTHVAGETVQLAVSRDRETVELEIELARRPEGREGRGRGPGANRRARNPFSAFLGGQQPNLQGQQGREESEHGGIYKSEDGGESWRRVNTLNPRPMYFSQIRVDPSDPDRVYVLGISLYRSDDGGETFSADGADRSVHVDHHALWINPTDGRHMILGNDGGVYVTHDRMQNWTHHNQFAIGQFYHVTVGPRRDYKVYGGLQDNGSWGGPSRSARGRGPANWDWISIGGGDGFICRVDANDPDLVYFESQNGGMGRRHFATGERARIRPQGERGRGGPGGERGERPRWNWRTPFFLSHHNSKIFYTAGNRVYRSLDRGNALRAISPDIAATDRGSATALAESPLDPNLLYVGTDDGALWVTRDGGHRWIALHVPAEANEPDPDVVRRTAVFYSLTPDAPAPAEADDDPELPPLTEAQQRRLDRFRRLDADGDGKVSREEVPERMRARLFENSDTDTDGDGFLDAKELEALARRGRGVRGRRPDEGGAMDSAGRRAAFAGDDGRVPDEGGAMDSAGRRAPRASEDGGAMDSAGLRTSTSNLGTFLDGPTYVAEIVASRFERDRVYLALDGHRSNHDGPLLFVSDNAGTTWSSLNGTLPASAGSTRTIDEDLENPNILYAGCEFGAWVSIDRGASWTEFGGLPTVAVHAFAQHPTAGEIVAGTHGRSLWIADVTALRPMAKETPNEVATLFRPNAAIVWRRHPSTGEARGFVGENPPSGARIFYAIGTDRAGDLELWIESPGGDRIATLEAPTERGLHEVRWNLRRDRRRGGDGPNARFRRFGPMVESGAYVVAMRLGDREWREPLVVELDPEEPDGTWAQFEHVEEEFFRGEKEEGADDEEASGEDSSRQESEERAKANASRRRVAL